MVKKKVEQTLFFRWGMWSAKHKKRIIFSWILLIVLAAMLAPTFMKNMKSTSLYVRQSQAEQAQKLLESQFSQSFSEQDLIVVHSDEQTFDEQEFQTTITDTISTIQHHEEITSIVSPLERGPQAQVLLSDNRHTALIALGLVGDSEQLKKLANELTDETTQLMEKSEFEIYFTGSTPMMQQMIETQGKDMMLAEQVGIPVALVVLILAFGSLVAASLPIILGMLGLITTFGVLGVISLFHSFDMTVQSITSMIGLGVGIDYVLFIIRRFREELEAGRSVQDAMAYTMATTGKAIFFSGVTVLISMAGLYWLQASIFTNIALGTTLVVLIMMAVSLTLLPALLSLLGWNINRLRIRFRKKTVTRPLSSTGWFRWSRFIMKRPFVGAGIGVILLVLLSTQAFGLKLGMNSGAEVIANEPAGKGMSLIEQNFSGGMLSPVSVVIQQKNGKLTDATWQQVNQFVEKLQQVDEVYQVESLTTLVKSVGLPLQQTTLDQLVTNDSFRHANVLWNFDRSADTTVVRVTLKHSSDSLEATKFIQQLRDDIIPESLSSQKLNVFIGGSHMAIVELTEETMSKTPIVIVTVLALSYVLLMLAFRSWLIPLKAIFLNILSVGASFGLLVWVFLEGHGSWIGIEQIEYVQVFLPVIAFAVLFGLSMDYEVFLVGRMKEEWGRSGQVDEAIANGIAHTSGPITQAATIMIAVFGSFLFTAGDTKQIGFALGVAILIDVTIVRILLVPTLMKLLGKKAWTLPKWLDKRLPHVELSEGEVGK